MFPKSQSSIKLIGPRFSGFLLVLLLALTALSLTPTIEGINSTAQAISPLTIDPWIQQAKLLASDAASSDRFGVSVAISGDVVVIGAFGDDSYSGSAYVFEREQGGGWSFVAKLTALDAASYDGFGWSVAISGDTVVVGANGDDANTGSAYLFERNQGGSNNWGLVAKLTALDADIYDFFGKSVAISGDVVIVGADGNSDHGLYSGSAYLFERDQGGSNNWGQVKKLTALDAAGGDQFGESVAINGGVIVVGAYSNDAHGSGSGAAYLFERDQGGTNNWGQVKKLTPLDAASGDYFGKSVAISGDMVVVGADGNDDHGHRTGSAYLFERNQGGTNNWEQVKKLTALDADSNDLFGYSVAISGHTVVVGAL